MSLTYWKSTVLVFCILFALCAFPILAVKVPPLLDYPSHLARVYIITHPNDALLAQFYAVDWKITPALALDLIIPVFTRVLDIFAAGKLFILLTIFLLTSGTFALNYALHGEWNGAALCFLFVFNGVFWDGLLPYIFAIAVALWATAGWIALRKQSWVARALFSACAVTVLFLSHLAGVGLYLLAIFCYEISRLRWTDLNWRRTAFDAAVMLAPFLITLPLLSASPTSHDLSSLRWGPMTMKWIGPYLVLRSANLFLDGLFGGFLLVFVIGLVYLKRLDVPRVAWSFLILCGLSYLLVPSEFFDGSEIDIRLPVAFVFFVIGLMHWRIGSPRAALVFNGIIAIVLAMRVGAVALAWQAYGGMVSEYEASFAQIEPGSRVLVTTDLNTGWSGSGNRVTIAMDQDAIGHVPALAAIERSSLVSEVFADPYNKIYGILKVKPPYRSAIPTQPLPVERLLSGQPNGSADDPIQDWPQHYDYVYVQYASPGTQLALSDVTLLYQGSSFQLYKVQNPA